MEKMQCCWPCWIRVGFVFGNFGTYLGLFNAVLLKFLADHKDVEGRCRRALQIINDVYSSRIQVNF